jgi:hypothetical protein
VASQRRRYSLTLAHVHPAVTPVTCEADPAVDVSYNWFNCAGRRPDEPCVAACADGYENGAPFSVCGPNGDYGDVTGSCSPSKWPWSLNGLHMPCLLCPRGTRIERNSVNCASSLVISTSPRQCLSVCKHLMCCLWIHACHMALSCTTAKAGEVSQTRHDGMRHAVRPFC